MIISHEHKFIFIKTRKTAGTSVEISLSRYCGPDDVITAIAPQDEAIRKETNGRGPQKYKMPRSALLRSLLTDPGSLKENIRAVKSSVGFYNHMPARVVKTRIPARIWNSYYKFCFERNPWDKVVSDYFWKKKTYNDGLTFDQYIDEKHYPLNYDLYSVKGSIAVDKVGRYETLDEDLKEICARIGMPFDGWLPRAKGDIRPEKAPYRDFFSGKQKDLVANAFRKEIEYLGYSFSTALAWFLDFGAFDFGVLA